MRETASESNRLRVFLYPYCHPQALDFHILRM